MATVTQDADAAAVDPRFPTQTPAGCWSRALPCPLALLAASRFHPVPISTSKDLSPWGSAPFHRRLVRRLSTRSPGASAPDGQPATTPEMR